MLTWQFKSVLALAEIARKSKEGSEFSTDYDWCDKSTL